MKKAPGQHCRIYYSRTQQRIGHFVNNFIVRPHVQIHVCGGPISTAAALQMEAAIPNFMIHELHRYALLEPNTKTCVHNYMPENGMYSVPDLPGLGQELTPETLAASRVVTVK
ncbi:enolase C-terminal domain-like protein [Desulfovibrio sp. Huiquan2017]|uniref:enolase C-terminal domain-like protein n=1 Tax=Desulfovibrio sp. Huiquan2017 TaxID=2816861 RepID=UPI001A9374A3|nr:enolase C-terminal domain-like protein [Desulfovibrio sp. Huiquan2017]